MMKAQLVKAMKGLVAGPLSQLAPVKSIMKLDRNDARFVESQEVLAEINSKSNLAEILWEEFEHLDASCSATCYPALAHETQPIDFFLLSLHAALNFTYGGSGRSEIAACIQCQWSRLVFKPRGERT